MRKILLLSTVLCSIFMYCQNNNDLKNEIEKIKIEITELRSDIQTVKSHNIYLNKILEINTPILEQKLNNNEYKITKIVGNKKENTISINFLIAAKDENKTSILLDFSIVDLLGNEYQVDLKRSTNTFPKLTVNVPMNIKITFKDIIEEPKIIKLFRFSSRNEPERNSADFNKSKQEFRDLNVNWE